MIRINQSVDCCGCASCVQVCPPKCISFPEDKQGFRYPVVSESNCIDCGACELVCPMTKQRLEVVPSFIYAAKNKNVFIRRTSSSGGVFTLLAEQVLALGGVVFGARFDGHWEVVHDYAETAEGITAFRGSKYMQSKIGDSYRIAKSFLHTGRKVLFTGTPCQIAGLKSYLKKDFDNLLCVDFVCHGVPSPKVWRRYLKEIVRRNDRNPFSQVFSSKGDSIVKNVIFRDKCTGWKNYSFTVSFSETSDEREQNIVSKSMSFSENAFMNAFLNNIILRPSCYECRFKAGRSGSDITLGDFWGIDKLRPSFDDDLGTGLVMMNTEKGHHFCSLVEMDFVEMTYDEAKKYNPCIYKSSRVHSLRPYFFWKLDKSFSLHGLIGQAVQYKPDFMYRVLRKLGLVK